MADKSTILVVDDEPDICALVINSLKLGGYAGIAANDGRQMMRLLRTEPVDLVILDLTLGDEDGLQLLKQVRDTENLPVIILTGRGEPIDRIIGLELGADDYLPKPFEPRELVARVRSVLRRALPSDPTDARITFSRWCLDTASRQLTAPDGSDVVLTSAEFDLLAALARHPNRVLNRDLLLETTRNRIGTPYDRSIDVHVMNLRRKIEADPKSPKLIKTVRGIGYIFTPDAGETG